MATIRHYQRLTLVSAAVAAVGSALVAGAAPAFAANAIDVTGIGPTNVGVDYSCDASAGATAIKVMVGAPEAESPSATGAQNAIVCDGTNRTAVIVLDSPLSAGQTVQVRVALVDRDDTVVSGQNKVVTLG